MSVAIVLVRGHQLLGCHNIYKALYIVRWEPGIHFMQLEIIPWALFMPVFCTIEFQVLLAHR